MSRLGTPETIIFGAGLLFLACTYCFLLERYDCISYWKDTTGKIRLYWKDTTVLAFEESACHNGPSYKPARILSERVHI